MERNFKKMNEDDMGHSHSRWTQICYLLTDVNKKYFHLAENCIL